MWMTLVHANRFVQKNQRTFIPLRPRVSGMLRFLLAVGVLLTPLAITHVASSFTYEDDQCTGCPWRGHECSDLCRPYPKPDGCNVATSIGCPFKLQPLVPSYKLGSTNYGILQPHRGLTPDIPTVNSAGQYSLNSRDTLFPKYFDPEENYGLTLVNTDAIRDPPARIIDEYKEYLDKSKLSSTGVAGSYYLTDGHYGPCSQHDCGYEHRHPSQEPLNLLSQPNQGYLTQYDNDYGQCFNDQKLCSPTPEHGYDCECDQSCPVVQTGYPTKLGNGQIEYDTKNNKEQKASYKHSDDMVQAPYGFGYEHSCRDQDIPKTPSSVLFKTGYPPRVSIGNPTEQTDYDRTYSEEYIPKLHSPYGVPIQYGFPYETLRRGQGIPKIPAPVLDQSGYLTNLGYALPAKHMTGNDQSYQEQNVPKVPLPNGFPTQQGLGYDQPQGQGTSNIPSLTIFNTGYSTEVGYGHPTESIVEYDPSHPERNGAAPSSLTGLANQQDFGIEESYPRQGLSNVLATTANQDDHPSNNLPLNRYNEKQLFPPQTKLPSTSSIAGSNLNSYRPSSHHNFGYRQNRPSEESPKLLTPVGVECPLTNGVVISKNPGHDGSSPNQETGAFNETPWDATTEVEQQTIKLFDGCSVSQSQLQDIISSFKRPDECVLTVPHILSGSLHRYAHVIDSFPDSIDVGDAFVHLPSDLLVPFDCYRRIASVFASDLPLFQECCGEVLDDGQFVDSFTISCIVASSKTPERRLILTRNDLALPFETYKNYISRISPEDKNTLRVVLPEIEKPISYGTYKQVFEKYVDGLQKDSTSDKNKTIKLLGSKTKLPLEQFMAVINHCHAIKEATVTLPSKKTVPMMSFIPLAKLLGDEYTRSCSVNIPNTPHVLPFTVVKEIFKLYLEKKTIDLSTDTDVNWMCEVNSRPYDPADVEIFSTIDKEHSKGSSCYNIQKESTTCFNCPDSQEPQYLLCRPHNWPNCPYYDEDGNPESTQVARLDGRHKFSSCDRALPSINILCPSSLEPFYACECFEKCLPK